MSTSKQSMSPARVLVESALMVAIATVLSIIPLLELPYGGSVTIGSMLPVIIISYRHGIKWGSMVGFVFAVIQQFLGLKTLSYVTTWQSILAVVLLDYIIAYLFTGLGGIFRRTFRQPRALLCGSLLVCVLRYACHVISGATVWAGLSIPTNAALIYSFGYNATYMLPETIITVILAYYIGSMIDLQSEQITPFTRHTATSRNLFQWIGGLLLVAAIIIDSRLVFSNLQNAETGDFDITGLSAANWPLIIGIFAAGLIAFIVLLIVGRKRSKAE